MNETFYCSFCGITHRKDSKKGKACWKRINKRPICIYPPCFYYQFGKCRKGLIVSKRRTQGCNELKYECEYHKPMEGER